jgi:hypothetical protein
MTHTHKANWSNKEACHQEALKYSSKVELSVNSNCAYRSVLRNKWLDDVCGHMQCVQRTDRVYQVEGESGWIEEGYDHMPSRAISPVPSLLEQRVAAQANMPSTEVRRYCSYLYQVLMGV